MQSFGLTLVVVSLVSFTFAQTGPGGVGKADGSTSLKLWLKSDFGTADTVDIGYWTNAVSVPDFDVSASIGLGPDLSPDTLNGYPILRFSGMDYFQIVGSMDTSNFITDQATTFVVCKQNTSGDSWVYGTHPHQTKRFSCNIPDNSGKLIYDIGSCCSDSARVSVTGLTGYGSHSLWSFAADMATGKQLYRNGDLLANLGNSSTYDEHFFQTFRIGESFAGDIAEIIIFKEKLNKAERIIVENYLTSKYGLSLVNYDLYTNDDPTNGNYDFDVAAIGRYDTNSSIVNSRGSDIVQFLNPDHLDVGEFLFWGHDGASNDFSETSDIPSGTSSRLARTWKVNEVDTSGNTANTGLIDVRFDLSDHGNINASDLRLLLDTDGDGLFSDETGIAGAINYGQGVYGFATQSGFQNELGFTLGTTNSMQSPLPVVLIRFDATVQPNNKVELDWQTASELSFDRFEVERATNESDWVTINSMVSSGSAIWGATYTVVDPEPVSGSNYYRLKMVDTDGGYDYSSIQVAEVTTNDLGIVLYPNPASNVIHYWNGVDNARHIQVRNLSGQTVELPVNNHRIDISKLSHGHYYIVDETSGAINFVKCD